MTTQDKFKAVVKEGIQQLLKPLGFRKKGNNFYAPVDGIGHLVNVQKSSWNNKDQVSFTINIGIFLPEYWHACEIDTGKQTPIFPSDIDCLLRTRIGQLKGGLDVWYTIDPDTDIAMIISIMQANINEFILPYFKRISSKDVLLQGLLRQTIQSQPHISLMVFGLLGEKEQGRIFYHKIVKQYLHDERMLTLFRDYAVEYQIL